MVEPKKEKFLTPREKEIALLLSSGWTTKEISTKLSLDIRVINTYRCRIHKKLSFSGSRLLEKTPTHLVFHSLPRRRYSPYG